MQPLLLATKSPVRRCAHEVLDAVPPIIWFIRREMRARRQGLSIAQFRTLVRLERSPSQTLSVLAEHLGASRPSASRVVSGLVQKDFVKRTGRSDDRRQISLAITPKGREVLKAAWSATRTEMERQLSSLPPDDLATVIQGMQLLKPLFGSLGVPSLSAPQTEAE